MAKTWTPYTLIGAALLTGAMMSLSMGCTDPEVQLPTTETGDVHDEQTFMNVGTRDVIEQRIAEGDIEFRPGFTFQGIMMHITSFKRFQLEFSYERVDGTRSDFLPVEPDEPEYPFANATAVLPEPATAIWVRVIEGQQDIEFLASRFFKDIPADGVLDIHFDDYDPAYDLEDEFTTPEVTESGLLVNKQGLAGRWIPSDAALSAGRTTTHSYEGAPNWNPSACGGAFLPGTRDLAEYLIANFNATHYGGYSCRQNTANSSKMSVHGTGRAIDLHYNRVGGGADNAMGDPTANWLVANSQQTGTQLVIWDRTNWSVSRRNHRAYGGPHPHDDHLHIEVTAAAARREAPFYSNPSSTTTPAPGSSSGGSSSGGTSGGGGMLGGNLGAEGRTCMSSTLGRRVPVNTCVQMAYQKYGGRCNWARCSESGYWTRAGSECPGTANANPSCGGSNPLPGMDGGMTPVPGTGVGRSCNSQTLGRSVPHGTCVQVNYQGRTCSRCGWYTCADGAWMCTEEGSCSEGAKNGHADCGAEPEPEPGTSDGKLLGEFDVTYYYIANENDYTGTKSASLNTCAGSEIAKVDPAFLSAARLEGTAKLSDGRVVNVGSSSSCFEVLGSDFPWGKGNKGNALEPFRSLATDQDLLLAYGTLIYIKQYDGLQMPAVDGIASFKHDGCFRADDIGGAIVGRRLDFFAGTKEAYKEVEKLVPSHGMVLTYEKADTKCAALKK